MAFVIEANTVISFAEVSEVRDKDQRIFNANESLTESVIRDGLERATGRILAKLKMSTWWKSVNPEYTTYNLPEVDANLIISRQEDFTDLCVYMAMADYILPGVADFSDPDSAERQKMSYYSTRADSLFIELLKLNDWYDFDGDGTISDEEKTSTPYSLKRVR